MLKEQIAVTIRSSPEIVFALVTDLERLAVASNGQVKVERAAEKPAGSFRISWTAMGPEPFLCETVEWDPPRRCVRRLDLKDLPTELAFTLEPCAEGTRLTLDLCLEPKSLLYKMMLPVLGKKIKAEKEQALKMLESRLNPGS